VKPYGMEIDGESGGWQSWRDSGYEQPEFIVHSVLRLGGNLWWKNPSDSVLKTWPLRKSTNCPIVLRPTTRMQISSYIGDIRGTLQRNYPRGPLHSIGRARADSKAPSERLRSQQQAPTMVWRHSTKKGCKKHTISTMSLYSQFCGHGFMAERASLLGDNLFEVGHGAGTLNI
jgi:hypothetical protein